MLGHMSTGCQCQHTNRCWAPADVAAAWAHAGLVVGSSTCIIPDVRLSSQFLCRAESELQQAEARAVRKAVSSRMHTLDEAFLMTLGGFVRAAGEAGDKAIHGAPDTRPPHVSDQPGLKASAGLCGLPCLLPASCPMPSPFARQILTLPSSVACVFLPRRLQHVVGRGTLLTASATTQGPAPCRPAGGDARGGGGGGALPAAARGAAAGPAGGHAQQVHRGSITEFEFVVVT